MKTLVLLVALLGATPVPPLPPDQIAEVQHLIRTTESRDTQIKAQLVERQQQLARAYDTTDFDHTRIADLQEAIVQLQRDLLDNYHSLQVGIRRIVGSTRFNKLKKRIDMALETARKQAETTGQTASEETKPPNVPAALPLLDRPLASGMSIVSEKEGWRFYEDGQPVMFYRTEPVDVNGARARADYIHPLMGLDGQVITEDFPRDHLHHRGIFWTWHQVTVNGQPVGDAWACQDFLWDVREVRVTKQGPEAAVLLARVHWKSPLWQQGQEAFVEETVSLRLLPRRDNQRIIDFRIGLRAMQDKVLLGGSNNAKGYGGFTARIATPDDTVFTGPVGQVTPQRTPVFGGPWMNLTGTLDGRPYGAAILQHPSNPLFPEAWILRHVKRFSNMQNPVYPWRHPVELPTDKSVVLRYRLILHKGADIAQAWQAYSDMGGHVN